MKLGKGKNKASVYTFLEMAQMRFRPSSDAAVKARTSKGFGMSSIIPWSKSQVKADPTDDLFQTKNSLKFTEKLSQEAFLIGN